jgi:hypothetical protein
MAIGGALGVIQRMVHSMQDLARGIERSAPRGSAAIDPRPPKSFQCWRDPDGRFEFRSPSTWELTNVGGVMARSREIGSFARVDCIPASADPGGQVVQALERSGATVELQQRPGRAPTRLHGEIDLDGIHFRWDAFAYALPGAIAVLSLGNVVDVRRGRALERYEDVILASIRRHFRVTPRASTSPL